MTAPVPPAAPAVRAAPPSGSDTGGSESAAPFANALDGALAANRAPVGEGGAGKNGGGKAGGEQDQPALDAAAAEAAAAAELKAAAEAAGVSTALWALAIGGASGATTAADAATTAVPVDPAGGVPSPVVPTVGATVAGDPTVAVPSPVADPQATTHEPNGVAARTGTPPDVPGLGAAAQAAKDAGEHPGATVSALARAQGGAASVATGQQAPAPGPVPPAAPAAGMAAVPVGGVPTADAAVLAGLTVVDAPPVAPTAGLATDAPVDGGAGTSAAGTTVPVAGAAGALSAGAGGADRDPGSAGSPSADGVTELAATGRSTAPATVATATDADVATGAAAAQPVGTQVARQVAVLRGGPDGAHTLTLVLTPETLGPVEVQVTLSQGTVDLHLRGAHEQGRVALLDALPDLRRDLEAGGLTLSKVEVARDAGGSWLERHAAQQQGAGDRGGQPGRGEPQSRPWQRTADSSDDRAVPTSPRSTSSGVDVLA